MCEGVQRGGVTILMPEVDSVFSLKILAQYIRNMRQDLPLNVKALCSRKP